MALRVYDTLAREEREFLPQEADRVTMYVCGPTVYSYTHIGNARSAIVFDLLFRVLRRRFGAEHVVYARNLTDIDDKIIKASAETGEPINVITEKYTKIYQDELQALGALTPSVQPTATSHIAEMIALVQRLIDVHAAYEGDGHVLFDVESYEEYGALSKVNRDEMIAGARVEVAPYKKNPSDFVLWKPSSDDEPGWESPWGRGRPGWHLECSVMIKKQLGETIDIHCGGQDLRFPHHENEIAQSACAHNGAPLAKYWMHNGFLRMGADKMSKSLGNVVRTSELLEDWQGEVVRWALLSAHYRQPLEWTDALLQQSKRQLDKFYRLFEAVGEMDEVAPPESVVMALESDLNTPEAFAGLHELRDIAVQMDGDAKKNAAARLLAAGKLMGFFASSPQDWFRAGQADSLSADAIDALLIERAQARKAKDFARADAIRDQLAAENIIIEDGADGATWRRG